MELVAFVGTDTENLGQVTALINRMECEKIILVKDKDAPHISNSPKVKTIEVDSSRPLTGLTYDMEAGLKKELSKEFEVALSIASGNGKQHMALLSALLNLPVGIKIVAYTKEGIKFIT